MPFVETTSHLKEVQHMELSPPGGGRTFSGENDFYGEDGVTDLTTLTASLTGSQD